MDEHLPRKLLKRIERPGDTRFLTFSCDQGLALFKNDAIKDAFATHLERARVKHQCIVYAWVVMCEHVHLLIAPELPRSPIHSVLNGLKGSFARLVLARWRKLEAPILKRLRTNRNGTIFWEEGGGYDRNVFSDAEFDEKRSYIHWNPVRAGLCAQPTDWKWSSAYTLAGRGGMVKIGGLAKQRIPVAPPRGQKTDPVPPR